MLRILTHLDFPRIQCETFNKAQRHLRLHSLCILQGGGGGGGQRILGGGGSQIFRAKKGGI